MSPWPLVGVQATLISVASATACRSHTNMVTGGRPGGRPAPWESAWPPWQEESQTWTQIPETVDSKTQTLPPAGVLDRNSPWHQICMAPDARWPLGTNMVPCGWSDPRQPHGCNRSHTQQLRRPPTWQACGCLPTSPGLKDTGWSVGGSHPPGSVRFLYFSLILFLF